MARSTTLSIKAIGLGLVSLLAGLPAAAQNLASADVWQFEFVPYLWLAGIRSDIKLGPLPGSTVNIKSSSVLGALDFGAMGTLEARKGPWGGLLDIMYVKLGVSNQFLGGLAGGYNLKYDQTVVTMAGYYRFVDNPTVQVDVLGGARYIDAHSNLDIPTADLLGLTTVRQPEFELGALAARTLMDRLQPGGMAPAAKSLELAFEIVERSSA